MKNGGVSTGVARRNAYPATNDVSPELSNGTAVKKNATMKNTEQIRLEEAREQKVPWKKWGPYLSERMRRLRDSH